MISKKLAKSKRLKSGPETIIRRVSAVRKKLIIAILVFVVVVAIGYVAVLSQAAGFFVSLDPEAGIASGNATIVSDSTAYGNKAIQFTEPAAPPTTPPTTPTGSTTCPLPKYPTPSCTGVPTGVSLAAVNGDMTATSDSQVIDGKKITGALYVNARNVVVKNSEIHGRIWIQTGSLTIQDSTVGPPSGCLTVEALAYENYTATRVEFRNVGDGPRVSGDNVTVQDSYIHLCSQPGDHSDGIQGYGGGSNVLIKHNTIDQRDAKDVTSPIFFADGSKSATVQNNLLAGGGYTIRIHDDHTPDIGPWVITGNRIVQNAWVYGVVNNTATNCSTTTWTDNRLVNIDSNYNITSTGSEVGC
jgi:hypothetical protein